MEGEGLRSLAVLVVAALVMCWTASCEDGRQSSQADSEDRQITRAERSAITTSGNDGPQGYLVRWPGGGPENIEFFQWTESDGQITGRVYRAYENISGPSAVAFEQQDFVGTKSGTDITIELIDRQYENHTLIGTLENNKLEFTLQSNAGALFTVEGRPATMEDYNEAVEKLRERAEQARTAGYQTSAECVSTSVADSTLYYDPDNPSRICIAPPGYEEEPEASSGGVQIPPNCAVAPDGAIYCTTGEEFNLDLGDLYRRGELPPER